MSEWNLRKVDLNLLVALNAVLEEKHITNAAARLNISQSAMSKTLVRIKETFKDPILVRMPNGYELTNRATALKIPVQQILNDVRDVIDTPQFDPATTENEFIISVLDYAEIMVGSSFMNRIIQQAPNSRISVVARRPHVIEDLINGHIDITFGAVPNNLPKDCVVEKLFDGKMVCVVGKEHPLANKKMTLDDYLAYPHAILHAGLYDGLEVVPVDVALAKLGRKRKVIKKSPNFIASIFSLRTTPMILGLPRITVLPLLDAAGLVMHELPFDVPPTKFSLIWHKRNKDDPSHTWFREELKAVIKDVLANKTKPIFTDKVQLEDST